MHINSLPVSPLSSTVADYLSFLYGTANDLLMSQRLATRAVGRMCYSFGQGKGVQWLAATELRLEDRRQDSLHRP